MSRRAAVAALLLLCIMVAGLMTLDLWPPGIFSGPDPLELPTTEQHTADSQISALTDPARQYTSSTPKDTESYLAAGLSPMMPGTPGRPSAYNGPHDRSHAGGDRGSRIELSSGDFDFLAHYGAAPLLEQGRFAFNPALLAPGTPAWMGVGHESPSPVPDMDPAMLAANNPHLAGGPGRYDERPGQEPQQGAGQEPNKPSNPPTTVPEPSSLMLLAGGLTGLAVLLRLRKVR